MKETCQVVATIMGEKVPCPLVPCAPNLRDETATDIVVCRACKKTVVTIIKGTSTLSACGGVTVVKTMKVLTSGKVASKELGNQRCVMTGMGGCPGQRGVKPGHSSIEGALCCRALPLALELGCVVTVNG